VGRRAWPGRSRIGAFLATALLALAFASTAQGELVAQGGLFVNFSGGIAPGALPRHVRAPISVSLAGTVKTLNGRQPPALRRIQVAINRGGRLDTHGLPVCRRSEIEPATGAEALARCGGALVGSGSYSAAVALPEQSAYPSRGQILAFNARVDGRRAILAHIFGTVPLPISRVIVFHIRSSAGTYGTVLSAQLPAALNRGTYLKRISLALHRNFSYRGHLHSYLSAACEAPPGYPGAVFSFAHASMAFADGRTLAATLTRSCSVRG
jgi:hypothetical protein